MTEDTKQTPPASDAKFVLIVGALLVVIIATLAVLWVRERQRCRAIENEYARLSAEYDKLNKSIGLIFGKNVQPEAGLVGVQPVVRDDQPRQTLTVDGQTREAIIIGTGAGKRFGFDPGDVVIVGRSSSTQPATEGAQTK